MPAFIHHLTINPSFPVQNIGHSLQYHSLSCNCKYITDKNSLTLDNSATLIANSSYLLVWTLSAVVNIFAAV